MKLFTIAFLSSSLALFGISGFAAEQSETKISLDLANISFSDAVAQLARSSKRTYVIHPQVLGLKSSNIRLDNVPLPEAFRVVLAAYGVCDENVGNVMRLVPCPLINKSQRIGAKDPFDLIDDRSLK